MLKVFSEMSVNGIPYVREDDVVVGIGEVLDLELRLISSIKGLFF